MLTVPLHGAQPETPASLQLRTHHPKHHALAQARDAVILPPHAGPPARKRITQTWPPVFSAVSLGERGPSAEVECAASGLDATSLGGWDNRLVTDPHTVEFTQLASADLVVDRIYRGGTTGNAGDDPLARLLPVGNQGGFRTLAARPRTRSGLPCCIPLALSRTGLTPWTPTPGPSPTSATTGRPGRDLHDTPRKGNLLLAGCSSGHTAARQPGRGSPVPAVRQTGHRPGRAVPGPAGTRLRPGQRGGRPCRRVAHHTRGAVPELPGPVHRP